MPQEIIFTIAALIAATGVIIGGLVSIYKLARRIGDSIGVDSKGRTLAERLDRVEHQLWENGGSSLADRVNKIEKQSAETNAKLDIIEKMLTASVAVVSPTEITPKRTKAKKVAS